MSNMYESGSLPSQFKPHQQGPKALPRSFYGSALNPAVCTAVERPDYVLVNTLLTTPVGFFFGNSASLSEGNKNGAHFTASNYTTMLDDATVGTTLNINPSAWSGSSGDADSITFVYRGGLDGSGRI